MSRLTPSVSQAFESITVSTTAVSLTAATVAARSAALITVESAAVRFRLDGTAPTATVGHVLLPDDGLELEGGELSKAQFISRDGSTATLRASYGN